MNLINPNIEPEVVLRSLCEHIEFHKLSQDAINQCEKFPIYFPVTTDIVYGAQVAAATMMVLTECTKDGEIARAVAMAFLYRWWKVNRTNEFTETEL